MTATETFDEAESLLAAAQRAGMDRPERREAPHPTVQQLLAVRQQLVAGIYQIDALTAALTHTLHALSATAAGGGGPVQPRPLHDGCEAFED